MCLCVLLLSSEVLQQPGSLFRPVLVYFCVLSDPPKVFLSGSLQSGLSVKRGCEIRLDANISGAPYPQITWYWNNQVIQPEPLRKRPEKPLKKKVEKKEEEKKEEEKKEEAEGEKKEEKKQGEVEGEEKKEEGEVKEGEEKKEEVAEPEVEELDYVTLKERLTINNSRRGVSSVVIRDSMRADHGVYMVKVENDQGIASAVCEVNVLGENPPLPYFSLWFDPYECQTTKHTNSLSRRAAGICS